MRVRPSASTAVKAIVLVHVVDHGNTTHKAHFHAQVPQGFLHRLQTGCLGIWCPQNDIPVQGRRDELDGPFGCVFFFGAFLVHLFPRLWV